MAVKPNLLGSTTMEAQPNLNLQQMGIFASLPQQMAENRKNEIEDFLQLLQFSQQQKTFQQGQQRYEQSQLQFEQAQEDRDRRLIDNQIERERNDTKWSNYLKKQILEKEQHLTALQKAQIEKFKAHVKPYMDGMGTLGNFIDSTKEEGFRSYASEDWMNNILREYKLTIGSKENKMALANVYRGMQDVYTQLPMYAESIKEIPPPERLFKRLYLTEVKQGFTFKPAAFDFLSGVAYDPSAVDITGVVGQDLADMITVTEIE
jgi:hypothetical protein